jgi:hypothetical protein
MRHDMAKVIVERPRRGSRVRGTPKGLRRRQQKLTADNLPRREGIRRRSGHTKEFNEHLGPLWRYLLSNVGHPWDKVFSEICAHINRNSAVQDHVRDHVWDFVEKDVILVAGVPCHGTGYWTGRPLDNGWGRRRQLYVCPKTGLLKQVKPRPKQGGGQPARPRVRVDETHQCHFLDGAWHLVSLQKLPQNPHTCRERDVVLNTPVASLSAEHAAKAYGAALYAVAKRRLGKRELRQYPVPLD